MKSKIYIGTYTENTASEGIYCCDFKDGILSNLVLVAKENNPSFIRVDEANNCIYAANENKDNAQISALSLGSSKTCRSNCFAGSASCHVEIDEKWAYLSNYMSGDIVVVDKNTLEQKDEKTHVGSGKDAQRQSSPHVHSSTLDPVTGNLLVADLGIDKIIVYSVDKDGKLFLDSAQPEILFEPGTGPRMAVFSLNGEYLYAVGELSNEIIAFKRAGGGFEQIQTISTLINPTSGGVAAHIFLVENTLYVSNRGEDNIAVFAINKDTGLLDMPRHFSSHGMWPRHFLIHENNIIIANQNSNNVVVKDLRTDKIISEIHIASPVCVG